MLNTVDIEIALRTLETQRSMAAQAEDDRQRAWRHYLTARERADEAQDALLNAEHEVKRAAARLAIEPRRPNRDERRAQVEAGLSGALRDLPF